MQNELNASLWMLK